MVSLQGDGASPHARRGRPGRHRRRHRRQPPEGRQHAALNRPHPKPAASRLRRNVLFQLPRRWCGHQGTASSRTLSRRHASTAAWPRAERSRGSPTGLPAEVPRPKPAGAPLCPPGPGGPLLLLLRPAPGPPSPLAGWAAPHARRACFRLHRDFPSPVPLDLLLLFLNAAVR